MELSFQLMDCDYVLVDNKPILRLFGKTKDGKSVCGFYEDFLPYFYVLPKKGKEKNVEEFLQDNFKSIFVGIREVQKFLPIGFQKEKTRLLKIILTDPSQIPRVRDELKAKDFVLQVFEADILFKYRFMADFDLNGMKWVEIEGEGTNTNTVKVNRTIKIKKIKQTEEDSDVPLKHLAFDIEVATGEKGLPDATKDPIAMISLAFFPAFDGNNTLVLISKPVRSAKGVQGFRSEKEMLEEFISIVNSFDPDVITGYNINNFDLPYLLERLKRNKLPGILGRCKQKQVASKKIGARFRNRIVGRFVVDVYELVKESVEKGMLRLKRYGLGDVAEKILGEGKVDIAHSEITKYWNGSENDVQKLIEYCRKDSELALKILLKLDMLGKFIELSKVSGLLLQDVLDGSEAARVENLLLKEFNKRDFVVPNKPEQKEVFKRMEERETKGFKGALVLEPKIGLHRSCVVYLDFKAMYPSIFISFNICPTTLLLEDEDVEHVVTPYGAKFVSKKVRHGIIPKILENLIKERNKVKEEMKKSSDELRKILDAKQYALKIMANAFYGYTGYPRAKFYVLDIANSITSCGRMLIQKTKNFVEGVEKLEVVYGDTDSVMVKLNTTDLDEALKIGKELEEKINKELEGVVEIKIEKVFRTLFVLTKKRYAGWSFEKIGGEWKEEIVTKGIETVRRDWCELVSKTLYEVLEMILKEQNPRKALEHVKDVLKRLNQGEVPIEELIITKSISKPLREYKGVQPHVELVKKLKKRSPTAPSIGDRIDYVIIKGPQLISKRAEDPEYVKEHGLKIDSRYYIESQLLPPLERVFEALGVRKADIMSVGKQLLLTQLVKETSGKAGPLESIEGLICSKCEKTFRRPPLIGKCSCGGELLYYFEDRKSRYWKV